MVNFVFVFCRYSVHPPADGLWGEEYAPGKWNGMIGMIREKKVMVGVGAFVNTPKRSHAVNFTLPMDYVGYTFMYERPKELSRKFLFAKPYKRHVRYY